MRVAWCRGTNRGDCGEAVLLPANHLEVEVTLLGGEEGGVEDDLTVEFRVGRHNACNQRTHVSGTTESNGNNSTQSNRLRLFVR